MLPVFPCNFHGNRNHFDTTLSLLFQLLSLLFQLIDQLLPLGGKRSMLFAQTLQ
jgi:hypothetical protein